MQTKYQTFFHKQTYRQTDTVFIKPAGAGPKKNDLFKNSNVKKVFVIIIQASIFLKLSMYIFDY